MSTIVLRGRKVVGGVSEGEALVTRETISGWGGIDPRTGKVIETRHELCGISLQGQGAGFPRRQGLVGLVAIFSSGAARWYGPEGHSLQPDHHQGRARRGGDAGARHD